MKKIIISLLVFSIFQFTFSQKKELKTVDKLLKSGDYENALTTLESINSLIETSDDKTKSKYYYLKGLAKYQNGTGSFENKLLSVDDFNKVKEIEESSSKIYSTKVDDIFVNLFNSFVDDSRTSLLNENYKNTYKNLEAAYTVSKKDTLYLYNAALVATEAEDYTTALNFYERLISLGYTGVSINYLATEKESGKEQVFQDKKSRDFSVDVIGTHESPRDEMAKSVEIDMLRSIAAIYRNQENLEKSIEYL
jgi:tetratricopeptide (TPR) repeat protein